MTASSTKSTTLRLRHGKEIVPGRNGIRRRKLRSRLHEGLIPNRLVFFRVLKFNFVQSPTEEDTKHVTGKRRLKPQSIVVLVMFIFRQRCLIRLTWSVKPRLV